MGSSVSSPQGYSVALSPPQMGFLRSTARHALMLGGVGSGKTLVGALWALTMAIRFPGLVGLVGAQNPSQLSTVVLKAILPMLEKANIRFVYGMAPPGSWGEDRFTRHVNVLSLSNGTQVLCRSMTDAGVDRNIRGLELAWAWCDEARDMSEYAFEVLASRMRGFGDDAPYSIRLTSTPNGRDWLWRKFAPESPSRLVGAELFRARTKDNRHLPQGYEDRIRASMGLKLAQQEVDGEWVDVLPGRACYMFDSTKHCASRTIDLSRAVYLSTDQGVAPYAGVIVQVDHGRGVVDVIDEICIEDGGSTQRCAAEFARRYKHKCPAGVGFVCDPTSARRDSRGGHSDMDIMMTDLTASMDCRVWEQGDRRVRGIIDTINAVNALLEPSSGPPRIMVDPRCHRLIDSLRRTRWDESGHKLEKNKGDDPTHFADALRYLVGQEFPIRGGGHGGWGDA